MPGSRVVTPRAPTPLKGGPASSDRRSRAQAHPTRDQGGPATICDRCRREADRLLESYWGPLVCPTCADELEEEGEWPNPWWEVVTPPHVAVLGDGVLWHRNVPLRVWPRSVEELGHQLEPLGVTQCWAHESALGRLGFPPEISTTREGAGPIHEFTEGRGEWIGGRFPSLRPWSYWWKRGGHGFDLHVPAWGRSPWRDVPSAAELLARVSMYERATRGELPWKGNGTITSDVFLRRRCRTAATEHPEELRLALERPLIWHREPFADELRARYCYGFDLNLAYCSPASSLALPTGPFEHVEWPRFSSNVAGIYLVEVGDETRWVTGPTLERLEGKGHTALEGYIWPASSRHLRPWYEVIRRAREELLEEDGVALAALKSVCREGLGRMASKARSTDLEGDALFQPYWAWAVIAEARERLAFRADAVNPVAIDTDALYFLSNRTRPELLAGELNLRLGDELGSFKITGRCLASKACAVLDGRRSATVVAELRELVG